MNKMMFLRKIELFEELPDEALAEVADKCVDLHFPRGKLICEEDKPGDSLFVIGAGLVQVFVGDGHGGEKVVCHLAAGDHFGEMAMFTGQPRTASCRALSDVTLFGLTRQNMESLLTKSPSIALEVIRTLCLRLARATGATGAAPRGRLMFVTSPDRRAGRTTLAINLAAAIHGATRGRVLVYDPQLTSKAIAAAVGIGNRSEIAQDLLKRESVDLDRCLHQIADGLFTLLPQDGEGFLPLKDLHHHILFGALRENFDYVIVDSTLSLASVNRYLMQQADHILVVLSPENSDPVSYLDTFRKMVLEANHIETSKVAYGIAPREGGAGDFPQRLGRYARDVSFELPHAPDLVRRAVESHQIVVLSDPGETYSAAVTGLGRRMACDRTVEVLAVGLPDDGAARTALLGEIEAFFKDVMQDFEAREEPVDGVARPVYRAYTDDETLDRVLPRFTEFLTSAGGGGSGRSLSLRVNGRVVAG